jgi:predicted lipoprotein with Yx(FWY)xxD motif
MWGRAAAGLAALALVVGCGSSGPPASSLTLRSAVLARVGRVLVTGMGQPLYVFAPDQARRLTCSAGCQEVWPPLGVPAKVTVGGGVRLAWVGKAANPHGQPDLTYDGWPLYTFIQDDVPGEANGQGLDVNGGDWFTITPAGNLITLGP